MACDVTKGLSEIACKNTVGGLKNIYFIPYGEYDLDTTSDDVDGHVINNLGTSDPVAESFRFPLKNTGNTYEEEIESSRDNGTTVFNQNLNFIVTKINAQMQYQMKVLSWGRPHVIVETNAGDFFMLGLENGMEISGGINVEGEMAGANQYAMVAEGQEKDPSYFLSEQAITDLKATVSTDNI